MRRFLKEDQGDTTAGVALGAILVLLVIVLLPVQSVPAAAAAGRGHTLRNVAAGSGA